MVLGADPGVVLSRRAVAGLARVRDELAPVAGAGVTVLVRSADAWWWTWAGARANASLAAALPNVVDPKLSYGNVRLRLRNNLEPGELRRALDSVDWGQLPPPFVTPEAVRGLKFADVLPPDVAMRTAAERLASGPHARAAAALPYRVCAQ